MAGKKYPEELQREITALLKQGWRASVLAREYGIPESSIKHFPKALDAKEREKSDLQRAREEVRLPIQDKTIAPSPKKEGVSSVVLAIPDLHCPFEHPDALEFLLAVRLKYQPSHFVCLGDEIDAHAFSRFPKDPDGLSPGKEIASAVAHLEPFYRAFPDLLVCESNHTVRPWKVAFEHGLPASFLPTYSKFLNAPDGWIWKHKHIIDDVLYIHGEGRSGQNAHIQFMRGYRKSVVIGHIHSYAAVSHEGELFAVNSGCLIDTDAYCFKYAKHMPIPVSLGCSVIFHGKSAKFIPMVLDSHGRWVGTL